MHIRACALFFGGHSRGFCLSVFFRQSSNIGYRYRLSNFIIGSACHSVFVWRGGGDTFESASRVEANLFHMDKKMRFQKYPDTCGRGLNLFCMAK